MNTSKAWHHAAEAYKQAHHDLKAAQQREADAKDDLLSLAGDQDMAGNGVSVQWQIRRGAIDYKVIVQEFGEGIDLEKYRKKESIFSKINVSKEG